MRIAFAGFHIESVSFLEHLATKEMFEASAARGAAIPSTFRATNTVPGGVIGFCEDNDIDIVPIVYAYQGAVGPASDEAVEAYIDEIVAGLEELGDTIDGVLLHLHGAAVSPAHRDVDGYYIERVRALVGRAMPLVVAFDYHGNLGHGAVAQLDAAVAYKTSPHIDMGETGRRAARWMQRIVRDGEDVGVALAKPGLVVPSIFSATSLEPLASILGQAAAVEVAQGGAVDISVMAGFSYGDTEDTGFSVVVTGTPARERLQGMADDLSRAVWEQRRALSSAVPLYDAATAVSLVKARTAQADKPFVLLEHADRMNDSTYVLAELMHQNVRSAAVPYLWDAAAAEQAHAAGAGSEIDLAFGAWSSQRAGPRLDVRCKVLETGRKSYRISGPMLTGQAVDLGMTALIDIHGIIVSLVSQFAFAVDEDAFSVFGLEPRDFDVIVLRSKTHFRAVYEPLAEEILIVDTPDWGTAELTSLPYRHLDRSATFPFSDSAGA